MPVTGSDIFGREEDIAFLNDAWANQNLNVVTIVAWAGVGKSTLVNHWLRGIAAQQYRYAELVFGWSFYRQGSSGGTSSADEFLHAALTWFGDPDPRIGTAWEKGERLASLIAHRRTLLVLDGLEPLQYPPGPQEGRLREPSLQALLRELAAFNMGLCVITTRLPVADIADHKHTSVPRRDLEHLSCDAGARLLRALGVKGDEAALQITSQEFDGHCLALTLLGSYLTDAYNGDVRRRKEVSEHLTHDVRQGAHARKVMEFYQTWFGEGPELSVLRMLGLFDRPADEKALGSLLSPPIIHDLTESLANLRPPDWRAIFAKLRRAKLLAGEDPHDPGYLDAHPLIREYFGEQLRNRLPDAWKECNRRLYEHYRRLAPPLPDSFSEMEPLFRAVIYGCKAGLFRQALHEIYIPQIQRGNASFAANVLGTRGALLSVLSHFFEHGDWGSPIRTGVEGQRLTAEDQLFLLMQAALNVTATRGMAVPEARVCYERAESLCYSLNCPQLLYATLMGQWRYSFMTEKLSAAMQIAKRVYSLTQVHNDPALLIGALSALAPTHFHLGDFRAALRYAMDGVQLWRSGEIRSRVEDLSAPAVICLFQESHSNWHLRGIGSCQESMADAISLAKKMNDTHALAMALMAAAVLNYYKRCPEEAERLASEAVEVSTRQSFAQWLTYAKICRGWARSVLGDSAQGLSWIEDGIREYMATGSKLGLPEHLAIKAEAFYFANHTCEALKISEAEAFAERYEGRSWLAELQRLRGVFLAAIGADETEVEASFSAAIRIANGQKSISLARRAKATYAEYRRQKARALGGHGFRLPICSS